MLKNLQRIFSYYLAMPQEKLKTITFGQWCLELRRSASDPRIHSTLLRRDKDDPGKTWSPEKQPSRQLMALLLLFTHKPAKPQSVNEIHSSLWEGDEGQQKNQANVEKAVSDLNKILERNEDKTSTDHIVFVAKLQKYRLIQELHVNGNLDLMEAFPEWKISRVTDKLPDLYRNDDYSSDLRIAVNGLTVSVAELKLESVLKRGLRVQVSINNPSHADVFETRFAFRSDETIEACIAQIKGAQLTALKALRRDYRDRFEYRFNRRLPFGPLYHSNDWAIFGVHLAHTSSANGPMIEIEGTTPAWHTLKLHFYHCWYQTKKLSPNFDKAEGSSASKRD